jgi:hypothetical protein
MNKIVCSICDGFKELSNCCNSFYDTTSNGINKCSECNLFCKTHECYDCDKNGYDIEDDIEK